MIKFQSFGKSQRKARSIVQAIKAFRLKKILYPASCVALLFGGIVCSTISSPAQEDRPQIAPQDKVLNKKKKGGEPRALGLLQITANGKATLVPIAILIDGKFHDAGSYKAAPIPMAIETGIVYEGERTGSSLGLFTVNGALHTKAANAPDPWLGTGQWLPQGTEALKTTHKAETVPVGMEPTDEPPRLTKSVKNKDAGTDASPPTPKPPDTSQPASDKKSQDQTKPDQTSSGTTASQQTTSGSKPDSTKPAASESPKSDTPAPAPGEDTNSAAGDSGRPKLRRGKPTEPLPSDEDVPPGYAKAGDTKTKAPDVATQTKPDATSAKPDQSAADKTPLQLVPAISDNAGPDPRSYVFEWDKSEADERRKQVVELAQQQLHAYVQELAKNYIPAKPAPVKTKTAPGARKPTTKTPDLVLEDLQIRTFDLWANNQPVIVLTAKAHPPLPSIRSAAAATSVPEYSIALVARTDIYNNLHKLYVGVTDKYHLDITPRLELIDAVDADGDGRGELLFREISDAGRGYIIYRATGDTLWKMFDSLSPE